MIEFAESHRVGQLLINRKPFLVPKYQRPYAWEEEEVEDFIQDIEDLYQNQISSAPSQESHFFGGIVTVERDTPGKYNLHSYDLVDGQQRLATITMAMALVINAFEQLSTDAIKVGDNTTASSAKAHAGASRQNYFEYDEVENNIDLKVMRLTLSRVDATFFASLVKGQNPTPTPGKESHKRLKSAFAILKRHLIDPIMTDGNISHADKLSRLQALRVTLTDRCYMVHVSSSSIEEAYKLFAVLNDRGKTLSDGDLLRVYTLESLEGHALEQAAVEQYWDVILGRKYSDIYEYLRAYYTSYSGERAPTNDFVTRFREHFFFKGPITDAEALSMRGTLETMAEELDAYLSLAEGQWPFEGTTASAWERNRLKFLLRILKHTLCLPLLMSAFQVLPESDFTKLVGLLERFVFRYITMVGAHAARLGDIYSKYARNLRSDPLSFSLTTLQAELAALQATNATDSLFVAAIDQKLTYNQRSSRGLVKYLLSTIDDHHKWYRDGANGVPIADKTKVYDLDGLTIEHIYPQNPAPADVDQNLEPLKHKLGNLSVWGPGDNNAVGNRPFLAKRPNYQTSGIKLNMDLGALAQWTQREFDQRRNQLLNVAKKVFSA